MQCTDTSDYDDDATRQQGKRGGELHNNQVLHGGLVGFVMATVAFMAIG